MPNLNNDCFRKRYAVTLLGYIVLSEVCSEIASTYRVGFSFTIILELILLVVLVYIVSAFLYNLFKLNWKRLLSIMGAALAAFSLISVQLHTELDPEHLRFALTRPFYMSQVNKMQSASLRFKSWFWDESGGGIISHVFVALIYDETEQLLLSPELRTDEWINAVEACPNYAELDLSAIASSGPTRNEPRTITVKALGGHFFWVYH